MRTKFDPEKALEAILYIAPKVNGDMYKLLKMLYLADKLHLENHGSLITGDSYYALDYGPVATNTYDILKYVKGIRENDCGLPLAREALSIDGNEITVMRDANLDWLSRSDIKCIKSVIKEHGSKSFGELKRLTHDDAYHATQRNHIMDLHAIAATLPNGADVNQYFSDQYPD